MKNHPVSVGKLEVEISVGELFDKISILEIKGSRIRDEGKLNNVRRELKVLMEVRQKIPFDHRVQEMYDRLKSTNERLWEIEDQIRECERDQDFSSRFIHLARMVYKQNDLRAKIKKDLNELLGSELVEEKSYAEYSFH